MSLFNDFKILLGILFGLSAFSRFKEKITSETSILSVRVIKKGSIFKGGR